MDEGPRFPFQRIASSRNLSCVMDAVDAFEEKQLKMAEAREAAQAAK